MKVTNLELVPRKKSKERLNNRLISLDSKNITCQTDFNVIFSSTARRKPVKQENHSVKNAQRNECQMKLRAPFSKPYQKQVQEKILTKSCEILFECIRPYKDICITKKSKVKQPTQTARKFLKTTDIIYEWKATRKVHLISFAEEKPMPYFSLNNKAFMSATGSGDFGNNNFEKGKTEEAVYEVLNEAKTNQHQIGKTVSSEDFITSVFSKPEAALIDSLPNNHSKQEMVGKAVKYSALCHTSCLMADCRVRDYACKI